MVNWNRAKRYGYKLGTSVIPGLRPTQEQLLKFYQQDKAYIYDVKQFTLQWAKLGAGMTGARYFHYYHIKPLVFWNTDVVFKEVKLMKGDPKIEMEMTDGSKREIAIKGLRVEQIFQIVLKETKGIMPHKQQPQLTGQFLKPNFRIHVKTPSIPPPPPELLVKRIPAPEVTSPFSQFEQTPAPTPPPSSSSSHASM
jgi:hypothetical protein